MKTSCFGSRVSCSFRKALRAAATSGRSCSAACRLFFKDQVDVVEEPRNPRLAHLHLFFRQAFLKFCKRTIRLLCYKFLNQIYMRCKRESLVPAEFVGTDTTRFALTLDESPNSTQRHVVNFRSFDMNCCCVADLTVLDQKNHKKRYFGRSRIDNQLPSVAKMEYGTSGCPYEHRQQGKKEHERPARPIRDCVCEPREKSRPSVMDGRLIWHKNAPTIPFA